MLRGSRAHQLTGKRKGKVQEDEESSKVSRVDRLRQRNIGIVSQFQFLRNATESFTVAPVP